MESKQKEGVRRVSLSKDLYESIVSGSGSGIGVSTVALGSSHNTDAKSVEGSSTSDVADSKGRQ